MAEKKAVVSLGEQCRTRESEMKGDEVKKQAQKIVAVIEAKISEMLRSPRIPPALVLTFQDLSVAPEVVLEKSMFYALPQWSLSQELVLSTRMTHGQNCDDKGACSHDCRVSHLVWTW